MNFPNESAEYRAAELGAAQPEPGQDPRAIGTTETLWNLMDFTPEGRPDFHEQTQYDCCHGAKPATEAAA